MRRDNHDPHPPRRPSSSSPRVERQRRRARVPHRPPPFVRRRPARQPSIRVRAVPPHRVHAAADAAALVRPRPGPSHGDDVVRHARAVRGRDADVERRRAQGRR
eukprot:31303-Pelagococcus_subviridis.AAC.1